MKKVLLGLGLSLFSLSSFAASPRYFEELMRSRTFMDTVSEKSSLTNITLSETYRCIGCFLFTVQFYDANDRYGKLHTVQFKTQLIGDDFQEFDVQIHNRL